MDTKYLKTISRGGMVLALLSTLIGVLSGGALPTLAAPGDTTRVSVDSSGGQANDRSYSPSVSGDGRFVAFTSGADNLVSGDTNATDDIFVHERQTGQTTRVSVDSSGVEANDWSGSPALSDDGRFVAFYSEASNLVSGDANGIGDVFVHDRQTGVTTRESVDSNGTEANDAINEYDVDISGDGRYVVFTSDASNLVPGDTNGVSDVFVHDRQTGTTTRVSVDSSGAEANSSSSAPAISSDGRYVAFASSGTNLVAEDTNEKTDTFVHDLQTGATTRVSVNSSGVQADGGGTSPDISGDGRYVTFRSESNNLAPEADEYYELIYVHDRQTGQTILASRYTEGYILVTGEIDQPTISRDGRYVAFSFYDKGDNNGIMNIWVRDLQMGTSVEVMYGNESSFWPSLSADGNVVAFSSGASNLVSGDTNGTSDVFVNEVDYGPEHDPTVVAIAPTCGIFGFRCSYPTSANVSFIVIFSEDVTGVTADDFSLTMRDGVSGASIAGVSGYGSEYFVTVDTGTGDGLLDLDVIDDDSIKDTNLNPLGGAGAGNGDTTKGRLYQIDKNNPIVTGITRADSNPTGAENVHFTVTFSEGVWPVDASDFQLTTTGSISGATITRVIDSDGNGFGNETNYIVTVNTGTGDGTLRLDLIDDDSILDVVENPLGGVGAGNGDFTVGELYTIDKSVPSIPNVTGILRADRSPTLAKFIDYYVTFSDAVNGVDPSDFTLSTTGSFNGAFVKNVSGGEDAYTVTIDTGSGDGTLRLDLIDDDSIQTSTGTPLGGPGVGNGNFTTGESYTIDENPPSVTSSLRADPNPTAAANVSFIVSFSEPVYNVDMNDFALSTTGNISGATITEVSGSDFTYTVTVATGSGDGTLRLDILDDGSIADIVGHTLGGDGDGNGNFTSGEEYTVNKTPAQLFQETVRSTGNNDGWVLESAEDSNVGGNKDSRSTTFVLGDDSQDRQLRSILHFPTYYLPDNAVITRALLLIKLQGTVGTDPFTTHQNVVVDIRSGAFGFIGPFPYRGLQVSDFQSPASRDEVGLIENNPYNSWYWSFLDSSAFEYINLTGITQIRLRFQLDDDDDMSADYLRFYSGDYDSLPARPQLVIEYYLGK